MSTAVSIHIYFLYIYIYFIWNTKNFHVFYFYFFDKCKVKKHSHGSHCHFFLHYILVSCWASKTSHALSNFTPQWSRSQELSYCLAAHRNRLWNHRDCSEDAQNKMVLGEVSNSLTYCALKQRKVNTTEDCTLYPLFFMTQTHLEICTEPSNTERIMLSLAAIGWATVSPVAISSGCFSISLNQKKKLGQPRVFCWCPTVYQTYLCYDGKPQRLYSGCNNLLQPCQCLRWAGLTYQWSHRSFGGAQGNDFYFPLNCANSDGFFQRGGVSILLTQHHKTPTLSHEKIAL